MLTFAHPEFRLASAEAKAAQRRVLDRLHSKGFLLTGYHFCVACRKVTEKIEQDGFEQCCFCGSSLVKFCPPVP